MALPSEPAHLIEAAQNGNRRAIARLITIVEEHREGFRAVLAALFPRAGRAHVIGLTGPPGAGKSTLTDRLIAEARAGGDRVGVLAVDPSSPFTGGAVLGDRVRMQDHASDPAVYIRSMASRGHLGGLSEATPRAVVVLDGLGMPYVFVETVGVGQAEVDIVESADTTVVVLNPGWGDSIQAAKAGLLEVGDVFVVNKADRDGVEATVTDLNLMLDLGPPRTWRPPVLTSVATTGDGIEAVWRAARDHRTHLEESGGLEQARAGHLERELRDAVVDALRRRAAGAVDGEAFGTALAEVVARRLDPWTAADRLLAGE